MSLMNAGEIDITLLSGLPTAHGTFELTPLEAIASLDPEAPLTMPLAPLESLKPEALARVDPMQRFDQVLVLEVECAKDKHADTQDGKYRRDTPWLVEAFRTKGLKSEVLFITNADSADSLATRFPRTAFLGRVNPMDYEGVLLLDEYIAILEGLNRRALLLGPVPEHMDRLGSKMILYEVADTSLGIDDVWLHRLEDMQANDGEMERILPRHGPARVLKMMRGSTGLGVWKLENVEREGNSSSEADTSDDSLSDEDSVVMTDAYTQTAQVLARGQVLEEFCKVSREDAISMPFLPMIADGEFRFLMSKFRVLQIVHKKPVDESAFTATLRSGAQYRILDLEEHSAMVASIEQWARDMRESLGLEDVPYWWSVDCIEADAADRAMSGDHGAYIPSATPGRRLVLSEINCSCLGLVADTSPEAKLAGMRFADMIADICLSH